MKIRQYLEVAGMTALLSIGFVPLPNAQAEAAPKPSKAEIQIAEQYAHDHDPKVIAAKKAAEIKAAQEAQEAAIQAQQIKAAQDAAEAAQRAQEEQDAQENANRSYAPQTASEAVKTTAYSGSTSGNSYDAGNCTWYAKSQRADIPNSWGNAGNWLYAAQASGFSTGQTPQVGAVATMAGHVAIVTGVSGSSVTVSEMNWEGLGVVSTRTAPASSFTGFIY